MDGYKVPARDSEIEYTVRRSRFIGRIWVTDTEEQALFKLNETRERHRDASHNVYAYIIKGGATRYSDDGEPGGTAGMPVLEVLRREDVNNVLCVVTRYFGGVLLGAGGLVRAYSAAAKMALIEAGVKEQRLWAEITAGITYNLLEQVRLLIQSFDGEITNTEYASDVAVTACIPEEALPEFEIRLRDISCGGAFLIKNNEKFK